MAEDSRRDTGEELFRDLRRLRGGLAGLRAAAETLQAFPDMEEERRRRLLSVVVEESERLGEGLERLERRAGRDRAGQAQDRERSRLPLFDLLETVRRAFEDRGLECEPESEDDLDPAGPDPAGPEPVVDVAVEPLTRALGALGGTLRRDLAVVRCGLGARLEPAHVLLDVSWSPEPGDSARLHDWQAAALESGDGEPGHGPRPVARRHDGEAWFVLDRDDKRAHVRLLLPLGEDDP